ncbi:esterase-like activity of phytase family protein, partial [Bauldia litoralis]
GGPEAGAFLIESAGNYGITDAAFLPDGDLLVLERSLRFPFGFTMRLRRIAGQDLAPGATVDGEILVEADLRYQIDNMEGLAVGRNEVGETIIAIVSDDNESPLQRTLLLYFALKD